MKVVQPRFLARNLKRYILFLIGQLAIQFGINCSDVNQSAASIHRSSIITGEI